MKSKGWIIAISVLLCICLAAPVWAQKSQDGSSSEKDGMMGGGMHQKMMDKMHGQGMGKGGKDGCPMAMGGGGCPMAMGGGGSCRGGGWMGSYQQWMKNFMVHADLFNLSDKQMQQFENRFSDQFKNAVRAKADIQMMRVDLAQALRQEPMQTKKVRDLLNKIAEKQVEMQMNSLELYSQIMSELNEDQQKKVKDVLGSPFAMPWEQVGSMDQNGGGQ